jgi:HK97 family phage prohead protease
MPTKVVPVRVKAGDQDGMGEGQFEAIVSVFGNVDLYGEVVMPGAFTDTLAEWKASGDPIPVLWSHQMSDPDSHIGVVLAAEERTEGLWVRGQLDLDAAKAKQVYRLLKGRRVKQFSFAYDVIEGAMGERDGEPVYELRKLALHETGPCLLGANPDTELLDVKSVQRFAERAKAGHVSPEDEAAIDDAVGKITGGMKDLRGVLVHVRAEPDSEKATPDPQEHDPARPAPSSVLSLVEALDLEADFAAEFRA